MKVIIKKEYDGHFYVGSCENLPGCYAQNENPEKLITDLRQAIEFYRKSYMTRNQDLPQHFDAPILDLKIRFDKLSTSKLKDILENYNFHEEKHNEKFLLFMNSSFPFNRVLVPITAELSPLIVAKIFGRDNIVYVGKRQVGKAISTA